MGRRPFQDTNEEESSNEKRNENGELLDGNSSLIAVWEQG